MSFAKWCEQSRAASLEAATDCVEAIYRLKRNDPTYCSNRSRGDFLYDYVDLHVGYLSQLARLGSAYSMYATRFLGAVYSAYSTPACAPYAPAKKAAGDYACPELCFKGKPGEECRRPLLLEEVPSDPEVEHGKLTLKSRNQTEEVDARVDKLVNRNAKGGAQSTTIACEVTLTLPSASGVWVGELVIVIGKRTIRYTIIADVRVE